MKYFLLMLYFILIGCTNNVFTKTASINQMKVIVWDMFCADELFTEKQIRDTTLYKKINERYKIYDAVFAIHNTSKKEFYRDYQYYLEHPDLLKTLMDSVQAYGLLQRNKVNSNQLKSVIPN
jgi:hypothetical protein